jgi:Holliday junction resolvase
MYDDKEGPTLPGHPSGEEQSGAGELYNEPINDGSPSIQETEASREEEWTGSQRKLGGPPKRFRPKKECLIEGCRFRAWSKGLCPKHRTAERAREGVVCIMEGCMQGRYSRVLCEFHYGRLRKGINLMQPKQEHRKEGRSRVAGSCSCEDKGLCKFCQTRTILRSSKNKSREQERQLAKEYQKAGFAKARRVPASGAIAGLPGDVEVEDFLLAEAKFSGRGKLTINPAWIDKIRNQARQAGKKNWALHAWVKEGDDNYRKIVIVDPEFFFDLLKQLKAYESNSSKD